MSFKSLASFNCPNCSVLISPNFTQLIVASSKPSSILFKIQSKHNIAWNIYYSKCLSCDIPIIKVVQYFVNASISLYENSPNEKYLIQNDEFIIYPIQSDILPDLPEEIPENYRNYFNEAYSVLTYSPAASAALSRRCLQFLLVEKAGVINKGNLAKMIDEVIDSGKLPSYLSEGIIKIKEIGNYAAHPNKSTNSNEIIDVELGEAEWSLDILQGLFDFYLVQPIKEQKRREEWEKKMKGIT